jgi:hypothetical protein
LFSTAAHHPPPPTAQVATTLNNLATCQYGRGAYDEAAATYRSALAVRKRALGEDHADTASSMNNLALCLTR